MTVQTIQFPDLVKAIIPFIKVRLQARQPIAGAWATNVGYRLPSPMIKPFIRIQVIGGVRLNIVHRETRVLVEVWHEDEPRAAALAEICAAELEAATRAQAPIASGVWIKANSEDFSVPVNNFDPVTNGPRYQFYFNPILTGSAV